MKTTYKNRLDILDYAIDDLYSISALIISYGHYISTVGTNKERDESTTYFLSNLINDIAGGIEKTLEKELEEDKSKKCKS